jgi:hypothetical protein
MRPTRLTVFGLVAAAGALVGAITACAITVALGGIFAHSLPPASTLVIAGRVGAIFGVLIGPLTAFTLLRRAQIGLGLLACSIGAAIGGSLGLYFGLSDLNPYVPLAIYRSPIPQAFLGAAVGVASGAVLARRAHATRDSNASAPPNVRRS